MNNKNVEVVFKDDAQKVRVGDLQKGDCFIKEGDSHRLLYMYIENNPKDKVFHNIVCLNSGSLVGSRVDNIVIPVKVRMEVEGIDG